MIGWLWRLLGVRSREPVDDAARPAALTAEERRVIREAAGRAAGRAFSRRAATEGDPKWQARPAMWARIRARVRR